MVPVGSAVPKIAVPATSTLALFLDHEVRNVCLPVRAELDLESIVSDLVKTK
jgi:hypothetical protein